MTLIIKSRQSEQPTCLSIPNLRVTVTRSGLCLPLSARGSSRKHYFLRAHPRTFSQTSSECRNDIKQYDSKHKETTKQVLTINCGARCSKWQKEFSREHRNPEQCSFGFFLLSVFLYLFFLVWKSAKAKSGAKYSIFLCIPSMNAPP